MPLNPAMVRYVFETDFVIGLNVLMIVNEGQRERDHLQDMNEAIKIEQKRGEVLFWIPSTHALTHSLALSNLIKPEYPANFQLIAQVGKHSTRSSHPPPVQYVTHVPTYNYYH